MQALEVPPGRDYHVSPHSAGQVGVVSLEGHQVRTERGQRDPSSQGSVLSSVKGAS